jgi:hypothetical protein
MSKFCISHSTDGEFCIQKVRGTCPKIGDEDPSPFEGKVVAIIDQDSKAGRLLTLLEHLDRIHQTEPDCDGLPFMSAMEEILAMAAGKHT